LYAGGDELACGGYCRETNCIKKVEVREYPELGMEAVWKIDVENFPAFIVVDDKGNDFYSKWIS
jgi:fumarate hydratase class I